MDTLEQYEERVWNRLRWMLPDMKTLQVEYRPADPKENLRRARRLLGMPEEATK